MLGFWNIRPGSSDRQKSPFNTTFDGKTVARKWILLNGLLPNLHAGFRAKPAPQRESILGKSLSVGAIPINCNFRFANKSVKVQIEIDPERDLFNLLNSNPQKRNC